MSAGAITVKYIARDVKKLLAQGDREQALRYAMAAVEPLLATPSDEMRFELRRRIFSRIKGVQYQANDFESVDYNLFEVSERLPLFRGPRPCDEALAKGNYVCVMGAAQTFGRLAREPWPDLLGQAVGLPVLNLSRSGVGPEFFLDKELLPLAQRARCVILQVMSGRSIGCPEFPGGRTTRIGSEKVNRRVVLEKLWDEDRSKAVEYVRRWNANYLEIYRRLRTLIARPTALLWLSDRAPWNWAPESLLYELDWGSFPQLIGPDLYKQLGALFYNRAKHVTGRTSEQPLSRVTGRPCPYFGNERGVTALHAEFSYYPSSEEHAAVAQRLQRWGKRTATSDTAAQTTEMQSA